MVLAQLLVMRQGTTGGSGSRPRRSTRCSERFLLDDSRRDAERARSAGVEVSLHIWEEMTHVFASRVGTLEAGEKALMMMGSFYWRKAWQPADADAERRRASESQRMAAPMTSSICHPCSIT